MTRLLRSRGAAFVLVLLVQVSAAYFGCSFPIEEFTLDVARDETGGGGRGDADASVDSDADAKKDTKKDAKPDARDTGHPDAKEAGDSDAESG